MNKKNKEGVPVAMNAKEEAFRLLEYHVWANDRVFRRLEELPEDIPRREIQSVFPTIFDTLVHIYRIDNLWLLGMQGRIADAVPSSRRILEETRSMDLRQLEEKFRDLSDQYRTFLDAADAEAVSAYPHPQFGTLHARHIDIIRHVVNHGTYHRGNITAMLRQLGHPGVPTDFVFYMMQETSAR
jgi:uncharacterized damage-inducible protein DinB